MTLNSIVSGLSSRDDAILLLCRVGFLLSVVRSAIVFISCHNRVKKKEKIFMKNDVAIYRCLDGLFSR